MPIWWASYYACSDLKEKTLWAPIIFFRSRRRRWGRRDEILKKCNIHHSATKWINFIIFSTSELNGRRNSGSGCNRWSCKGVSKQLWAVLYSSLLQATSDGPKLKVFKSNGSILALLSPQTKFSSRANPYNRCIRWLSEYTMVNFEGVTDLPIDVAEHKGHTFFYRGDIQGDV